MGENVFSIGYLLFGLMLRGVLILRHSRESTQWKMALRFTQCEKHCCRETNMPSSAHSQQTVFNCNSMLRFWITAIHYEQHVALLTEGKSSDLI